MAIQHTLSIIKPDAVGKNLIGKIVAQVEGEGAVFEGIAGVPMWRFFTNSAFIAIMATFGTLISSSMAAYAFARLKLTGKKWLGFYLRDPKEYR